MAESSSCLLWRGLSGMCRRQARFSDIVAFGLVLSVTLVSTAVAEIGIALAPPVAIRGSDLVVPLRSTDADDQWPTTLTARIGQDEVEAIIVWLTPRGVQMPSWTTPATPVEITTSDGRSAPPMGSPMAIIPVPLEGDGAVELLGVTWTPTRLRADPPFDSDRPLAMAFGPDADPPRDDPMDWFRWAIRADLESARPPSPNGLTPLARRVAVAIAAEWRAALERVAEASPGAAAEIATRLVATVVDESRPLGDRLVAAWPTDARDLAGLRAMLLDPKRTSMEAARAGLAWFDARPPFVAWVAEPGGDVVVIELANPTEGELVVLASWTDGGQEQALLLPPRSLTRHQIERPRFTVGPMPATEELALEVAGRVRRLLLGPRAVPVRPPGGTFGTLALGRTLAAMNADYIEAPPGDAATVAVLRRHQGRWEVFVEARGPGLPAADDRLTLQFGSSDQPVAVLEVRADGGRRVLLGDDDGTLETRTHRIEGLWRAVIAIPDRWLVDAIGRSRGGVVLVGLRRTGPGELTTFAGPPPPAWRQEIPVQAFALADWGDPGFDTASGDSSDASSTNP